VLVYNGLKFVELRNYLLWSNAEDVHGHVYIKVGVNLDAISSWLSSPRKL